MAISIRKRRDGTHDVKADREAIDLAGKSFDPMPANPDGTRTYIWLEGHDNVLTGSNLRDVVVTDILQSNSGTTIRGNGGNDDFTLEGNHNTLEGGADNDRLTVRGDVNTLRGGTGNDTLLARGGPNFLFGGAGNDDLVLKATLGRADGGSGSNRLLVEGDQNTVAVSGLDNNKIWLKGGLNDVRGGTGSDRVMVAGGENKIFGWEGDDTIHIDGDRNKIFGQGGDDHINVVGDYNHIFVDSRTAFLANLPSGSGFNEVAVNGMGNVIDAGNNNSSITIGGVKNRFYAGGGSDDVYIEGIGHIGVLGDGKDHVRLSGVGNVVNGHWGDDAFWAGQGGAKDFKGNVLFGGTGENIFYLESGTWEVITQADLAGRGLSNLITNGINYIVEDLQLDANNTIFAARGVKVDFSSDVPKDRRNVLDATQLPAGFEDEFCANPAIPERQDFKNGLDWVPGDWLASADTGAEDVLAVLDDPGEDDGWLELVASAGSDGELVTGPLFSVTDELLPADSDVDVMRLDDAADPTTTDTFVGEGYEPAHGVAGDDPSGDGVDTLPDALHRDPLGGDGLDWTLSGGDGLRDIDNEPLNPDGDGLDLGSADSSETSAPDVPSDIVSPSTADNDLFLG